MNTTSGIITLC